MTLRITLLAALCLVPSAQSAELAALDRANYAAIVPAGKETDAIYGDFVLRNDLVVAVVAAPGDERDANLTVRNVGGSLIDLTERQKPNDQLGCFYPGGGAHKFTKKIDWPAEWAAPASGSAAVAFEGEATVEGKLVLVHRVGYELRDGERFVRVISTLKNTGDAAVKVTTRDGVRLDGEFEFGAVEAIDLCWAHDLYWRQAYGVQPEEGTALRALDPTDPRTPRQLDYTVGGAAAELPAGGSVTWGRRLFPASDSLAVQALAYRQRGVALATGRLEVLGGDEPIGGALVKVERKGELVGHALTDGEGLLRTDLPPGTYRVTITSNAHGSVTHDGVLSDTAYAIDADETIRLGESGFIEGTVTDGAGGAIPAKVELTGVGGTKSPDFGPESAERGVKNLQYTPDGRFRCAVAPGKYRWVASHGSEHNAAYGEVVVEAGQTARLEAKLPHTVDTTGWLSSELHSHSSPSGDNTASQSGRVLNLLAEHLEFCPCTEHARIDVYDKHLAAFDAQHRMLTCPGMELTGQPLPLNHQNAFPLVHHPHEQDGGGPRTHPNPVEQIKRLARWDNGAEKVVQTNHPNTAQMVGDRDLDGVADGGFEAMFGHMDVIEVHPPELIFEPLGEPGVAGNGVGSGGWEGRGNTIQNWLQLLNLGYRVPGVVNTDAHYNFHGSGWMRNWVRSSTDDPAAASVAELVHEFEHGHVVMSNGPFMSVEGLAGGASALPGDDLKADGGKVKLRVVVRCPNWMEVNRVQVFVNGRPDERYNYTVRSHGDWFGKGPEVFARAIELELEKDAHLVVACLGEGRSLKALYGGDAVRDSWGRNEPVAVANPVFVDVDGDQDGDGIAFEPSGDDLGLPLPKLAGRKPSHGHGHGHGHGH